MGAVATIGHNLPASPFEAHRINIDDLYVEAKGWLDGEPITSQAQADKVDLLLGMIREAHDAADESRKEENVPFDAGKAEVQARYAPLIADTKAVRGKTVLAKEACIAALTPWRRKVDEERQAAARAAQAVADEAARKAAEAIRSAPDNLVAREDAEQLVADAQRAQVAAKRASAAKPTGLRTFYVPTLVDGVAAARHYWGVNREACEAFFLSLARTDVLGGKRAIPGFTITEEKRAV